MLILRSLTGSTLHRGWRITGGLFELLPHICWICVNRRVSLVFIRFVSWKCVIQTLQKLQALIQGIDSVFLAFALVCVSISQTFVGFKTFQSLHAHNVSLQVRQHPDTSVQGTYGRSRSFHYSITSAINNHINQKCFFFRVYTFLGVYI